ncbi:hypothetical protein SAMD00023353_0100020 [Rosellinia necatrix]|uniref:Uncharacterized protein n=1 Tax=Rosellinia necatrix TaxID=77044 RepID=A0A1S7UH34_ROSNE|nr:hypothetical protein SAMD00023353_0100020 [Rosellinia necatrix]
MDSGARSAALLALDEVFRITSEFIGIMNNLSVTTTSHQQFPDITTASATLTPACVAPQTLMRSREPLPKHAVAQDSQGPRTAPPTSQPFSRLDEATALLFLSCHCRLIEIYGAIFHAMQRCVGGSYAAPYAAAGIILPQLRVGGPGGVGSPALRVDFGSGPRLPPATISMYMALVATLSSQLWAQVQEALRGSGRESGRAPAGRLDVIGPTWDEAMEKTENMVRTIETVQRLL